MELEDKAESTPDLGGVGMGAGVAAVGWRGGSWGIRAEAEEAKKKWRCVI